MGILLRLATSRIGLALILCGSLYGWHVYDKAVAVREAKEGLVSAAELAAAEAVIAALEDKLERLEEAQEQFDLMLMEAQEQEQQHENDADLYLLDNPDPPADCRVDADLLDLLRND